MKLLVAEDDKDMARAVSALLIRNNYTVDLVDNGQTALDYLTHGDYDAAILDIMMPGMNGITVLSKARKTGVQIPIMMLTAMGETEDRINGFDAGADDYLPKPFDGGELLSRVRAMMRRTSGYKPDMVNYGDLCLDRSNYRLICNQNQVSLGSKAFQMMEMFMVSPQKIISVNEFMEHIWGWDTEAEINVVWVNISFLRSQLKKIDSKVQIRVIRGAGYMLEAQND